MAVLFTIAIFATATSQPALMAAGRTAASIPNTILNGKGAPLNSLGINGDFYIDTRSLLIYGPKVKSKWPTAQNLQGPVGAAGAAGVANLTAFGIGGIVRKSAALFASSDALSSGAIF